MTTHATGSDRPEPPDEYQDATAELYRCELALHDAHQSGVDAWVAAAGDHLHAALLRHYRAQAALGIRVPGAA